jgi:hypothetical protein
VERRLAVLAGNNTQALSRPGARGRAWPLALAVLLVAGAAVSFVGIRNALHRSARSDQPAP